MKATYFIVLAVLLNACATYSPSLSIPTTPLKQSESDLQASAEFLPIADVDSHFTDMDVGASFQYGYGVSDRFSLFSKIWFDALILAQGDLGMGISLSGNFTVSSYANNSRLILIPKFGVSTTAGDWYGGLGLTGVYQKNFSDKFSLYSGFGIATGSAFDDLDNGMGYFFNNGLCFGKKYRLNIELSTAIHDQIRDDYGPTVQIAPLIGVGWTFGN